MYTKTILSIVFLLHNVFFVVFFLQGRLSRYMRSDNTRRFHVSLELCEKLEEIARHIPYSVSINQLAEGMIKEFVEAIYLPSGKRRLPGIIVTLDAIWPERFNSRLPESPNFVSGSPKYPETQFKSQSLNEKSINQSRRARRPKTK